MNTITRNSAADDESDAALLRGELTDGLREALRLEWAAAEAAAEKLTAYLRQRLGAQRIYIPAPDRATRNEAVCAEYNGKNAAEVCRRHDISRTTLYAIVAKHRAASAESK